MLEGRNPFKSSYCDNTFKQRKGLLLNSLCICLQTLWQKVFPLPNCKESWADSYWRKTIDVQTLWPKNVFKFEKFFDNSSRKTVLKYACCGQRWLSFLCSLVKFKYVMDHENRGSEQLCIFPKDAYFLAKGRSKNTCFRRSKKR